MKGYMKRRSRIESPWFFALLWASIYCLSCPNLYARPLYDSRSFADIHTAVSTVGGANAVLSLSGIHRISRNLVVPENITLRFQEDASLFIEAGKSVSIEASIQAPLNRIFEGEGKVILTRSEVYPQWWGARGNGIQDDGVALQWAIDSVYAAGGGLVRLPAGTYLLNHISGPYYALKARNRVSVAGEGLHSVLKVGERLRQATRGVAVIYNHEELVSNCRYSNFVVDYNGKNNPRLASWGKDAKASEVSRMGAEFASDMIIDGVHFKDVSGAHCIWIGNHPINQQNIVRNCVVSNVGQSIPGNQLTDHSSIYIGGRNAQVSGNVFRNPTPCDISTAIEIHSSDTIVINNSVQNYSTAINIAGEANHCSNVIITNNIFRNSRNGVVIWHYTPYRMDNIAISGNIISVRETDSSPYPPAMGIIYGGGYVTSKANLRGLKISGNILFQETTTSPNRNPNTAIHVESVDDLNITGNTIYDFNGEAVYVQSRSKEQGMRGVLISENMIKNVGLTSTQERKRAIVLNSYPTTAGHIADVMIHGNRIIAGEKFPMRTGLVFNDGNFPRVEIAGNFISGTSQFEIANDSHDSSSIFYVHHRGRGSPANNLRASKGSQWVDITIGRTYISKGFSGSKAGNSIWLPMD
jgi:hypothetical protein